jgi:hypothetical protein
MENTKLRNPAEVFRDEMVMRDRICNLLKEDALTIPQITEALGAPAWEVTAWVMTMRRYGLLKELPKGRADDYFQYTLTAEE